MDVEGEIDEERAEEAEEEALDQRPVICSSRWRLVVPGIGTIHGFCASRIQMALAKSSLLHGCASIDVRSAGLQACSSSGPEGSHYIRSAPIEECQ